MTVVRALNRAYGPATEPPFAGLRTTPDSCELSQRESSLRDELGVTDRGRRLELDKGELSTLLTAVGSSRDRNAFRQLFAHFAPRLKSFMLRRGAEAGLAEDIVQEAMINVWRKAHLFDPQRASAATWVFTIGRNVHIDHVRRATRPELDPDDPSLMPEAAPEATETIARDQDAARLQAVLATLPDEQREILTMAFYEEKPHREIADELGLPLGTVKSRIRLAFGKLRNELGEQA